MKKARNTSADAVELRRRAEDRLRADTTKRTPARTEPEAQRFVFELQVHQIELEMQSESCGSRGRSGGGALALHRAL